MFLKRYRDVLGRPREGVHAARILGRRGAARFSSTAAADYLGTLAIAAAVAYFADVPLVLCTVVAFVLGELLHYVFGVRTNTLRYIGGLRPPVKPPV